MSRRQYPQLCPLHFEIQQPGRKLLSNVVHDSSPRNEEPTDPRVRVPLAQNRFHRDEVTTCRQDVVDNKDALGSGGSYALIDREARQTSSFRARKESADAAGVLS